MLVLSRKTNESIILRDLTTGEEVKVQVNRVTGQTVRLGFEASDNIQILRQELDDAQKAEAKQAAEAAQQAQTEPESAEVSAEVQVADPSA